MHPARQRPRNAVASHSEPERFQIFAHNELAAAPPWQSGVCFQPECSRLFSPSRTWQIYCCQACERAATQEARRWGHRLALPLLIWRLGKYERQDQGVINLTRAARRHVTQTQSAWMNDRQIRKENA